MTTSDQPSLNHKNFSELIKAIEKKFGIRLRPHETKNIHTFGELSDLVIAKINLLNQRNSGQQHAFTQLRDAISSSQNISREEIQMDTKLANLFPRKGRRKAIRELQFELGFDLKVLRPYLIIEAIFFFILIGAIITLFFNFIYGLETLALLILLINVAFITGKEFNRETVGELAEKIVKDKSKKPGKKSLTLSDGEITEDLKFIFGEFHPSSEEITRETAF